MSKNLFTSPASRRAFLRQATTFATLGSAGTLGLRLAALGQASAAGTSGDDYRALVCVFLYGGNDSFNTVLATDTDSWQHYLNHRDPSSRIAGDGSTSIALLSPGTVATGATGGAPAALGGVLPIAHAGRAVHAGRAFALHPMLKNLQQIYQGGRAAVLANVGPLVRPLSKVQYQDDRFAKPPKLQSHNDQQAMWQSFAPEGMGRGWGGRMGDLLMSQNGQGLIATDKSLVQRSFTCINPGSSAVWLSGESTLQYQINSTDLITLANGGAVFGSGDLRKTVAASMNPSTTNNLFAQAQQELASRAFRVGDLLGSKLPAAGVSPWGTNGETNSDNDALLKYASPTSGTLKTSSLAKQFQMVARLIDANRAGGLNMKRQVFMVSMGGFDTHDNQNGQHTERMAELNHAMAYFDTTLGNMPGGNLRHQVTTFTASDFGRTFTNNGDGTDHGWGAHHFVMGGAVQGKEVYGTFPQYSTADSKGVFSSDDQLGNGTLLPTTSVDQMAYTLGRWMGVSDTNLRDILPNLSAFNSSDHNLGFMG